MKRPDPSMFVGISEIAKRANVSPRRVQQWRTGDRGFPEPLAVLDMGPLWWWPDVEAWLNIPRPQGRPPGRTT